MTIAVVPIGRDDVAPLLDPIEAIYGQAFGADSLTSARFRMRLGREVATSPGFTFFGAFYGDEMVGFIYGYHLQATNWWPALIRPAMREAGVDQWMNDTFELVEFAVDPTRQQQGIGSLLYNALFSTVTEPRAMLGTDPPPTLAHRFYIERGWVALIPEWRHEPDDDEFLLVMGLDRSTPNAR